MTAGNWRIDAAAGQSVDVDTLAPIAITVTFDPRDLCQGVDLFLRSEVAGPLIAAVDLVGPGTLFADDNIGQSYLRLPPAWEVDTFTVSQTLPGVFPDEDEEVLAFVTFDATGVPEGV